MSSTVILVGVLIVLLVVVVLTIVIVRRNAANKDIVVEKPLEKDIIKSIKIAIMTDKGEIIVNLRPDLMPYTVANFMHLVNSNFYNGLIFHRVELWLIQGGDTTGTGSGGLGFKLKLEVNRKLKNVKGAIGMARLKEKDTGGSQFYILKRDAGALNGNYAVFGNVIKGMEVIGKIAVGDRIIQIKEIE